MTKSAKAGLQFPVGRVARYLKKGRYAGASPLMRCLVWFVWFGLFVGVICVVRDVLTPDPEFVVCSPD